jgi:hypothetical protein
MWILIVSSIVALAILPSVVAKATKWYADRCVKQSMKIVQGKLREYETLAAQYTKNGTPEELRSLIGQMEELTDELQMLDDNNSLKREN